MKQNITVFGNYCHRANSYLQLCITSNPFCTSKNFLLYGNAMNQHYTKSPFHSSFSRNHEMDFWTCILVKGLKENRLWGTWLWRFQKFRGTFLSVGYRENLCIYRNVVSCSKTDRVVPEKLVVFHTILMMDLACCWFWAVGISLGDNHQKRRWVYSQGWVYFQEITVQFTALQVLLIPEYHSQPYVTT